jgi:hypothetical protein
MMKKWNPGRLRCLPFVVFLLIGTVAMTAAAAEGKRVATVSIPATPELYAVEPQPLTVNQCGQCHPGAFRSLKVDGAKHRFDCRKCHSVFHAMNPKKGGWDAMMPKCASCHAEPHGKAITDCTNCHTDPHAPRKVPMDARLLNACVGCHPGPKAQLVQFPSKHSKLGCQDCHTSHGFKPSCLKCHEPHEKGQDAGTCSKCHSVHQPLQVTYADNTPAASCGACHDSIVSKWRKTPSKHGKVNCATCHRAKHRFVPQCTECHPAPHKKEILSRFPSCLACHVDVHDLPVKQGKQKP